MQGSMVYEQGRQAGQGKLGYLDKQGQNQDQVQGHHADGSGEGDEVPKEGQQTGHKGGQHCVAASHQEADHEVVPGVAALLLSRPNGLE